MNGTTGNWISIHVGIEGDMNIFLENILMPLLEGITDKYDRYFFIRYFDPSPHIRIRILPAEGINFDVLATEVAGSLHHTMRGNSEQQGFSLLSITNVEYEPEVERYGGPVAIGIAERHFMMSSNLVLSLLRSQDNWVYADSLGSAIRIHLAFLQTINLSTEVKTALVSKVHEGWLAHFLYLCPGVEREVILTAFNKAYEKQRDVLMANMGVLSAASDMDLREEPLFWMAGWVEHIKIVDRQLSDLFSEEEEKEEMIAGIYESYMHMTNNRLGINNIDESFIAYILLNLFEDYFH
ncbi:thiopeptide-type bacteriocin biosynthesis protein [Chitinophaga sp.]|uniref:thiopeptide-type bacteriocin biosynthesis protein n=1 Tax=Chitinophaga sp. TaxID=1869181 RepID=UPI002F94F88E